MLNQAAASLSKTTSRDLDHYRAQPGNWNVQATQLGHGEFRSTIRSLSFPGLTIYDNKWGAASMIRGQSPDGLSMIGAATDDSEEIPWCGNPANKRQLACAPPNSAIEFKVPANAHDVVLLITPQLLQQTCGEESRLAIESNRHLLFPEGAGGRLLGLALQSLNIYSNCPEYLESAAHTADCFSALLRSLEDCFAQFSSEDLEANASASACARIRAEAVHNALEHLEQRQMKTSAAEMAQSAGVSQKTLEKAFSEQLNLTPGRYLKLARLNRAHRRLASADPSITRVTEVALECGFSHLGRFSGEYRGLFGERPLQTLMRRPPHG